MTAFNAVLNVSEIGIEKPSEDADHLNISLTVAQLLPTQPSQAVMIPLGTLKFPIERDKILRLAEDLKREGEKLPKPSDLAIASSLEDINPEAFGKMRGED